MEMGIALMVIYVSIYLGLVATTFYILSYHSDKKSKGKMLFKDNELPKVSVIIPAFNEEKSIGQTIESISKSNYPKRKLEIIVVDDGSNDRTLEIARKYKSKLVKVFSKENGGKGTALNLGISKCNGEIIFSMDADTFVGPNSLKEMTRYFKNPEVMSVTPTMLTHNPKGIYQRIQQAEYLFGLFIRKAFSSVNAVHVTPGAFSAYRKYFFDKYGGYDEENITEDLEMSLRIQYEGYSIEYSPEAPAYTITPNNFKELLIQRIRWYTGLMKNTWKYLGIFGRSRGDLGLFVLPVAWASIFFSIFAISYLIYSIIKGVFEEIIFLNKVNFDFGNVFEINKYILERAIFQILTNNVLIFFVFLVIILWFYMSYATKKAAKVKGLPITVAVYFIFFALLFGFWWLVSIFYVLFNRKVKWR